MSIHPDWISVGLCIITALVLVVLRARWLRLAIVGAICVAALQPTLGTLEPTPPSAGVDVLLLVDRTTSMGAADYNGQSPRIDGVAADIEALTAGLPGARWAVITFDNRAHLATPWTTDASAVTSLATTMGWREETYGTGSDIAVAAPLAQQVLHEDQTLRPQARRHVVYFGDGEQTAQAQPQSFAALKQLVDSAVVLGYGTEAGGTMRQRIDVDDLVTRNGQPQLSRIDQPRLRQLADQLGGRYLHRNAPGGLDPLDSPAVGASEQPETTDLWWIPAIVAVIAMAFELPRAVRESRRINQEGTC